MTAYQLHREGDCNPYACPICANDEPQTIAELVEQATGLNGDATIAALANHGLTIVRAGTKEALADIRDHGLRADLTPTMPMGDAGTLYTAMCAYLRRLDAGVRDRARLALDDDQEDE